MTSTTTEENSYPKPPYDDCEEVWHFWDTPITAQCAYRAMERDGRVFKAITHKVNGLRYLYWHPDKNGIELWHEKDNVGAWANAIRYLDERFVYTALRIGGSSGDESMESGDESMGSGDESIGSGDDVSVADPTRLTSASDDSDYDIVSGTADDMATDGGQARPSAPLAQVQWALAKLQAFQDVAKYRILFDIPDFTGFAPVWQLTPALIAAMDGVLCTYHLTKGETVLYDKRSCGLVWVRRECSSYEIRASSLYALQYAQQFILHQLWTILTTQSLAPNTIPANSALWVNVYANIQHHNRTQAKLNKKQYRQQKKHKKNKHFQARKNKKRQMMDTTDTA